VGLNQLFGWWLDADIINLKGIFMLMYIICLKSILLAFTALTRPAATPRNLAA
jgi:hypothetical protein